MGLFDRMSRVATANFNALLDRLDDPKKDVELTVREMEEALRQARAEIVRTIASEKLLKKKGEEIDGEIQKWASRAELAVRHGDDDLAREALRHKRRLDDDRERSEKLRTEQRGFALEQKTELERMERTVEEVKGKKGILAARIGQARAGGGPEGLGARGTGNAFSEFRRMEDQIEGVEASIAASREVDEALAPEPGPAGLSREEVEARFRALEGGAHAAEPGSPVDVDDELSQLKTKLRVKPG
jgi:phage shock protein A